MQVFFSLGTVVLYLVESYNWASSFVVWAERLEVTNRQHHACDLSPSSDVDGARHSKQISIRIIFGVIDRFA